MINRYWKPRQTKRGQTIIEVMVATTIITIIMATVLNLMYSGLKFSVRTREETRAIGKANDIMNEGLKKANEVYPVVESTIYLSTPLDSEGFSIYRELVSLETDGENCDPGYGITSGGQPVFKKIVVTIGIPNKDVNFTDSRVIRVR